MGRAGLCTYIPVALAWVAPDVPIDVLAARGAVHTETHGEGGQESLPSKSPLHTCFAPHPTSAAPQKPWGERSPSTQERDGDETRADGDQ